jgi:hypothetical protein
MGEPRIFASFVQGSLDCLASLDASVAERARARIKPETLAAVQEAGAFGWLPVAHDVEITECLFAAAGHERACRALRANLLAAFEQPVLRSLVQGGLAILGRSPSRLLGWAPRVWALLYRDCGSMRCEINDASARLVLEDLPPEITASRNYLVGSAAAIGGLFDLLRIEGSSELERLEGARAEFLLRW